MRKVELFERIRRDHRERGWSIRRLSREHRVHRRDVRLALENAMPPPPLKVERSRPVLGPWMVVIDRILEEDRRAPRKQRHTARRIWQRLTQEWGAEIAEVTVRRYVRERKRQLYGVGTVMVPLHHGRGQEAEVDLGESWIDFPWGREKVNFFTMRACSSGAPFHWPLRRLTQQAFLEAHAEALQYLGGCFEAVRYDNLTLAVRKILRGRRRQETERFVALRSHYGFRSIFCEPGLEGAHEKGGVEGEIGWFRRNRLVPVPRVSGWEELEGLCLSGALGELKRHLEGHQGTVGEEWDEERELLRPLPSTPFETRIRMRAGVDNKGRVPVLRNRYSVPVLLSGLEVEVELSSAEVVMHHRGNEVARHERLYGFGKDRLVLDHYLEVLRFKPGAFASSLPLHQAKADGSFPESYQEYHRRLTARLGESEAARQMVDVLFLHRSHGSVQVRAALEAALETGAYSFEAVALGLRGAGEPAPPRVPYLSVLKGPQVPVPDYREYDRLLEVD